MKLDDLKWFAESSGSSMAAIPTGETVQPMIYHYNIGKDGDHYVILDVWTAHRPSRSYWNLSVLAAQCIVHWILDNNPPTEHLTNESSADIQQCT